MRSQLLRAIKPVELVIAIVQSDTPQQTWITPTGVEKQETNLAFMPQTFNTEEEFKNYLEMTSQDEETCTVNVFPTWRGENRKVWVADSKRTIEVGKLVDVYGNKTMPRVVDQAWYQADEGHQVAVDLIFPIQELVSKFTHPVYLKTAEERTLITPEGDEIRAMIVKATFFRTGSASENISPRNRTCHFKGMDSFAIENIYREINPEFQGREVDISFAVELQTAALALEAKYSQILSPTEQEED